MCQLTQLSDVENVKKFLRVYFAITSRKQPSKTNTAALWQSHQLCFYEQLLSVSSGMFCVFCGACELRKTSPGYGSIVMQATRDSFTLACCIKPTNSRAGSIASKLSWGSALQFRWGDVSLLVEEGAFDGCRLKTPGRSKNKWEMRYIW